MDGGRAGGIRGKEESQEQQQTPFITSYPSPVTSHPRRASGHHCRRRRFRRRGAHPELRQFVGRRTAAAAAAAAAAGGMHAHNIRTWVTKLTHTHTHTHTHTRARMHAHIYVYICMHICIIGGSSSLGIARRGAVWRNAQVRGFG